MRNYFSFVFLFFILNNSYSQELTATQKIPEKAMPGENYIVEVTIKRAGVTGFMKFFQGVPVGCTAKEIESKGGKFSFDGGGAKIIWITSPTEDQFTISYQVDVPLDIAGIKNVNGKVAYLFNSERKIYDLETKTIKIGDALSTPTNETVFVTGSDHAIVTTSPILKPKEEDSTPSITPEEIPPASITPAKKEETPTIAESESTKKNEEKAIVIPDDEPVKKEEPKIITSIPPAPKKAEKKIAPVNLPISPTIPVTATPSIQGKTFRVQIGAFALKPTIKGVSDLTKVVLENGVTKYFSGNFATYAEATKRKKELIGKGFQGAFVVSFQDGKIFK